MAISQVMGGRVSAGLGAGAGDHMKGLLLDGGGGEGTRAADGLSHG